MLWVSASDSSLFFRFVCASVLTELLLVILVHCGGFAHFDTDLNVSNSSLCFRCLCGSVLKELGPIRILHSLFVQRRRSGSHVDAGATWLHMVVTGGHLHHQRVTRGHSTARINLTPLFARWLRELSYIPWVIYLIKPSYERRQLWMCAWQIQLPLKTNLYLYCMKSSVWRHTAKISQSS